MLPTLASNNNITIHTKRNLAEKKRGEKANTHTHRFFVSHKEEKYVVVAKDQKIFSHKKPIETEAVLYKSNWVFIFYSFAWMFCVPQNVWIYRFEPKKVLCDFASKITCIYLPWLQIISYNEYCHYQNIVRTWFWFGHHHRWRWLPQPDGNPIYRLMISPDVVVLNKKWVPNHFSLHSTRNEFRRSDYFIYLTCIRMNEFLTVSTMARKYYTQMKYV